MRKSHMNPIIQVALSAVALLVILHSDVSTFQANALALVPPIQRTSPKPSATSTSDVSTRIPFVVQKLNGQPAKTDADEISSIVISVFFQEEAERLPENRSMGSITKPLILAYLKNLQYGDVRGKKYMLGSGINNSMFVARRIVPFNGVNGVGPADEDAMSSGQSQEELSAASSIGSQKGKIYNQEVLEASDMGYTTGEILGFVDVTEKNFGLAGDDDVNSKYGGGDLIGFEDKQTIASGAETPVRRKTNSGTLRPVLTNLSVKQEARCSGVGSALVDACESVVMEESEWTRQYSEMVLEVEEENEGAQSFYERRDYVPLFADPTSRRYDTSGLLLGNVRTTKICFRKDLTKKRAERGVKGGESSENGGIGMFFAKVREAIGMD